jgi:SAM-dependent methyltransferase
LIRQLDDAIGAILEEIDLSRSLLFFTSDHGDYAGHRGMLKKAPWIPFDDLARVPMVVAGQGVVGGLRVTSLVQNCDFALTSMDYADVEIPRHTFDTRSLRPLLAGHPGAQDEARAVLCATSAGWPMVRRGNLKYVVEERSTSAVLFDVADDPGETTNLLHEPGYRDAVNELSSILRLELRRGTPHLPMMTSGGRNRRSLSQLNVPARFVRGAFDDHDESLRSAGWLIRHMCDHLGVRDLSRTEVLDFGCGVKFSEALINCSLPIKRYVGFDVYGDLITFLQRNVTDDRFEYFHINAQNDLYNPEGQSLSVELELPIDGQTFDLITLLSVFTHLDPSDYRAMLALLRRFAKHDTVLLYSLYIDELTPGGYGLMDTWARTLSSPEERFANAVAEHVDETTGTRRVAPFKDLDPSRPLRWAVYSETYARELIEGTGWRVVSLSPPDAYIQHHFACAPC